MNITNNHAQMSQAQRRMQMCKIHIAKKQLCMTDDVYRAMLKMVAGVESSRELSTAGRANVIAHMQKLGAKFQKGKQKRTRPAADREALASKVTALLADGQYPDNYADAMSQRMFNVQRWEWLRPEQLHKLVAALNYNKKRKQEKEIPHATV